MKYLNLGCGGERDQSEEWVNLDDLHAQLPIGEGARDDLDKETNYVNFDVLSGPLPFEGETFDGVLASHFFEHFDAQTGLKLMRECKRVLKTGGTLLVSVPNAAYFREVYPQDRKDNWPVLFDTFDSGNTYATFFEAALWFDQHKVLLTDASLWCYFTMAALTIAPSAPDALMQKLNRRKFSVEMAGVK